MFYIARDLATPRILWGGLGEEMGEVDRVALYLTDYKISDPIDPRHCLLLQRSLLCVQ